MLFIFLEIFYIKAKKAKKGKEVEIGTPTEFKQEGHAQLDPTSPIGISVFFLIILFKKN